MFRCGLNKNSANCRPSPSQGSQQGFVLLLTLVVLVVLATFSYILTNRLQAQQHRHQYMIDYSQARYACDSAVKYAAAALEEISPQLISRPNEPDFSDLFNLSDIEYKQFLEKCALEFDLYNQQQSYENPNLDNIYKSDTATDANRTSDSNDANKPADFNKTNRYFDANDFNSLNILKSAADSNNFLIRGPYGPPWPLVTQPVELKVGPADVKIEIEDENAKYPFCLAMLDDETVSRQAQASCQTFFEWMWGKNRPTDKVRSDIKYINEQLAAIRNIKPFVQKPSAISLYDRTNPQPREVTRTASGTRRGPTVVRRTIQSDEILTRQCADFAKIFHSSLVDTELLAQPTVESETRKESALKYLSLWATTKVNVNTAPRHVLEAIFVFGGNEVSIADEIIIHRRIKPFVNMDDLKSMLFRFSDSIDKCKDYITTTSDFFTIRITATSGIAKASVVIAIQKINENVKRIAVLSG